MISLLFVSLPLLLSAADGAPSRCADSTPDHELSRRALDVQLDDDERSSCLATLADLAARPDADAGDMARARFEATLSGLVPKLGGELPDVVLDAAEQSKEGKALFAPALAYADGRRTGQVDDLAGEVCDRRVDLAPATKRVCEGADQRAFGRAFVLATLAPLPLLGAALVGVALMAPALLVGPTVMAAVGGGVFGALGGGLLGLVVGVATAVVLGFVSVMGLVKLNQVIPDRVLVIGLVGVLIGMFSTVVLAALSGAALAGTSLAFGGWHLAQAFGSTGGYALLGASAVGVGMVLLPIVATSAVLVWPSE